MTNINSFKKILIPLLIIISYLVLFFYTPYHVLDMNREHNMNMSKENCPFMFADNIICNTLIKRDGVDLDILNLNYLDIKDIYTKYKLILIYLLVSIFLIFKIKSKELFKIPILLKKLFSKGLLNSKAY